MLERTTHEIFALTNGSNTAPASPTNPVATTARFQNLDTVELVVVAIDISLVESCVIDDSIAVNMYTMRN